MDEKKQKPYKGIREIGHYKVGAIPFLSSTQCVLPDADLERMKENEARAVV